MIVTLLCARCTKQLGPRKPRPSIVRDALRAPAKGMARPLDPQAERIKAKKERKAGLRKAFREDGVIGAVKLYLHGMAIEQAPLSDECQDCLSLMQRRSPDVGQDPRNRRAVRPVLEPAADEVDELNFDHRNYPPAA